MNRITGRPARIVGGLALILASCGGNAAEPALTTTSAAPGDGATTSSTAQVAVTTTSSTTTTTLPPSGPPLAAEGDKNETVEAFQFLINCNGYDDLVVDGSFGPATRAGVEAAQTALGREATGAPDDPLLADLSRGCSEHRRLTGDEGVVTVVGNAAPGDPEIFDVSMVSGTSLSATITLGLGHVVTVRGADGVEVPPETATTWTIDTTQDYTIEVSSPAGSVIFALAVDMTPGVQATGDWIMATDGLTYKGTKLALGSGAQGVIDKVFDFLGHGVRGSYLEFDTDWYTITDPQDMGLRGIFIEGLAFLYFGPDPVNPGRPETFERWRFEGPSDDADGTPRPDDYVTTDEGVTVGDTLADLQAAYGSDVSAGSNSTEHYYRFSDSGGEMCFYFGASAPSSTSVIVEIASECRSG